SIHYPKDFCAHGRVADPGGSTPPTSVQRPWDVLIPGAGAARPACRFHFGGGAGEGAGPSPARSLPAPCVDRSTKPTSRLILSIVSADCSYLGSLAAARNSGRASLASAPNCPMLIIAQLRASGCSSVKKVSTSAGSTVSGLD